MVNWDLFRRNFTLTIANTHPYALTMFSIIYCNFRVLDNLLDLMDVE